MSSEAEIQIGSDFVGTGSTSRSARWDGDRLSRVRPTAEANRGIEADGTRLAVDQRFRERFTREAELAMSLEHPNVVPIHDAGDIDGRLYIAMRYVEA